MEVFVKFVGPVADPSDVDTEVVWIFWSGTDGEGMPLRLGDGGDLDEAPVTRTVVELARLLDLQTGHFGWKRNTFINDGFSMSKEIRDDSIELFRNKNDCPEDEPLPEAGSVDDQKTPVEPVVEMGEVEDLEVSASANKAHGADDHDSEDGNEGNTGGIGKPSNKSKYSRAGGKHPFCIAPSKDLHFNFIDKS